MISIIAAMSLNRVIGLDNKLPWNIPEDLEWFKQKTNKCPIIMGRKTHESIGRVLKGRDNIVITRNEKYLPIDSAFVYNSLEEAIADYSKSNNELFVIGGEEIYKQSLKYTDRIYLTIINAEIHGDSFFPQLDNEWIKVYEKPGIINEPFSYTFNIYERQNGSK